jgi:hypothetical protein
MDLICKELLEKYEWGGVITMQISLPTLTDPTKNIIQQALAKYNASSEVTPSMSLHFLFRLNIPFQIVLRIKKERRLILLLDGYDEIKSSKNLWVTNELSEWQVVVILGCRTEYSER